MSQSNMAILWSGDLRRPWQSPFGFPTAAGRLAVGESMLLICREDEKTNLLKILNTLVAAPASIQRARTMLQHLEARTVAQLATLVAIETTPLEETAGDGLIDEVERMLAQASVRPRVGDRFNRVIEPNRTEQRITGFSRMLARLRRFNTGLKQWAESGFEVEASAGRRHSFGQNGATQHHLTLWRYTVSLCSESIVSADDHAVSFSTVTSAS